MVRGKISWIVFSLNPSFLPLTSSKNSMAKRNFGYKERRNLGNIIHFIGQTLYRKWLGGTVSQHNRQGRKDSRNRQAPNTNYDVIFLRINQPGSITAHGDASKIIVNIIFFQFYSRLQMLGSHTFDQCVNSLSTFQCVFISHHFPKSYEICWFSKFSHTQTCWNKTVTIPQVTSAALNRRLNVSLDLIGLPIIAYQI